VVENLLIVGSVCFTTKMAAAKALVETK